MSRFSQQSAVITGGNSGIGLATALRFAQQGARVAISGRNQDTLELALQQLGEQHLAVKADVSQGKDLDVLVEAVKDGFGKIDHLVVNAGIAEFRSIEEVDEDHFDRLFNINVRGAFFTVQKFLPLLNDGASIVLIASAVTAKGFAGTSVYSATKAALRSFARTLSAELLLERGIRINVVSPGPIETPIFDRMGMPDSDKNDMKAGFTQMVPAKRFGSPDEVADAIAFLASKEASYIAGSELFVDGGLTQL